MMHRSFSGKCTSLCSFNVQTHIGILVPTQRSGSGCLHGASAFVRAGVRERVHSHARARRECDQPWAVAQQARLVSMAITTSLTNATFPPLLNLLIHNYPAPVAVGCSLVTPVRACCQTSGTVPSQIQSTTDNVGGTQTETPCDLRGSMGRIDSPPGCM